MKYKRKKKKRPAPKEPHSEDKKTEWMVIAIIVLLTLFGLVTSFLFFNGFERG